MRVETNLNRYIWAQGIRNVPRKVRVRVTRKRNDDKDSDEKFYCIVTHVPLAREEFTGLMTEKVGA